MDVSLTTHGGMEGVGHNWFNIREERLSFQTFALSVEPHPQKWILWKFYIPICGTSEWGNRFFPPALGLAPLQECYLWPYAVPCKPCILGVGEGCPSRFDCWAIALIYGKGAIVSAGPECQQPYLSCGTAFRDLLPASLYRIWGLS